MAFCSKCGSPVADNAAFCGKCGAGLSGGAGPAASQAGSGMSPNLAAALSYLLGFITGILFLVLEPHKNDRFVRFHAFQSIIFSVVVMIFWIVWSNLFWPAFGGFGFMLAIWGLVSTLVSLTIFLFWLFLMYKAYQNERFMIPVIGPIASKQAG